MCPRSPRPRRTRKNPLCARSWSSTGADPKLDPSGALPDGRKFAAAAKKTDYEILSLIESPVTSPLFMKR
jgi:hypothetical protein